MICFTQDYVSAQIKSGAGLGFPISASGYLNYNFLPDKGSMEFLKCNTGLPLAWGAPSNTTIGDWIQMSFLTPKLIVGLVT